MVNPLPSGPSFNLYDCHLWTDAHRRRGMCTQWESREKNEQRLSVHLKSNLPSHVLFIRLFSLLDRLRITVAAGWAVTTDMPQQSGLIPSQLGSAYGVSDSSPSILEWQNVVQSTAPLGGNTSSSAAKKPRAFHPHTLKEIRFLGLLKMTLYSFSHTVLSRQWSQIADKLWCVIILDCNYKTKAHNYPAPSLKDACKLTDWGTALEMCKNQISGSLDRKCYDLNSAERGVSKRLTINTVSLIPHGNLIL